MTSSDPESPAEQSIFAVRMEGISKQYPGVLANDRVDLKILKGSMHAVIGENGAGKSTLLGILYGRTAADSGKIYINEIDLTRTLKSPADAIHAGIGMVSQHYSLIPALSVLENCILGAEPTVPGGWIDYRRAAQAIDLQINLLGLKNIDLKAPASSLSIASQQKVEILKALYRGASILLLDEPTATLAPAESKGLFELMQQLVTQGATVVYITHKLTEVMDYSTAVTVLRNGKSVAEFVTGQTSREVLLAKMMGHTELDLPSTQEKQSASTSALTRMPRTESSNKPCLQAAGLSAATDKKTTAFEDVNLEVQAGEIVGIAGVEGSGQRELAEVLAGVRRARNGVIKIDGKDVSRNTIQQRIENGVSYIPEDRNRSGLIPTLTVAENFLLGSQRDRSCGGGIFLNKKKITQIAESIITAADIRTGVGGADRKAGLLSGGNQQKLLAARALKKRPKLLIACQPTRGLDTAAAKSIYRRLREAVEMGLSVLLISSDLDELFEISDRIIVMFNHRIAGEISKDQFQLDTIGALMTGVSGAPLNEASK